MVSLKFEYWSKIGGEAIDIITTRFGETLEKLAIVRNYYEFSAKITDQALLWMQNCKVLNHLEIVYSRNFDYDCINYLSQYCRNLRVLNLQDCPVQESLAPLAEGCPNLEELNMGGDSWLKEESLVGICTHQNLMVLHIGHFEHSDVDWAELNEPEKGKFVGKLLSVGTNLPNLQVLYIEKYWCHSVYIQDAMNKNRDEVEVKHNVREKLIDFDQVSKAEFENDDII